MIDLYSLKVKNIWKYINTQDLLFWLVNIYLFFEYVRPQTLYPVLDVLPYAQIILMASLIMLFLKKNIKLLTHPCSKLMGLFFIVILLSSVFAMSPALSFEWIYIFIGWLIVYVLIINTINTENRFLVFSFAFLLYSFKMSQFSFKSWVAHGFGFTSWGTGGGPGWFQNSGEFGIQMCIFLPLAFYFFLALQAHWPKWKKALIILFPLTALTGTISSSSRGAMVGAGVVMLWILLKSKHKIRGLVVLTFVVVIALNLVPQEQFERFEAAGEDNTSLARLERWEKGIKIASAYPVFGVGYKNWPVADRLIFGGKGGLPHDIFIECMSELGYSGLIVFALMILFTFLSNHKTRKLISSAEPENKFIFYMAHGLDGALVGYLASGFFVTVLYYPYFWINLSMTVALNGIAESRVKEYESQSCTSA